MALEHARFVTPEHPCAYLPGRPAMLDVRLLTQITAEDTEHLVERGWRRFGPEYFRPVCAGCGECISLRVPARGFVPSKSQRRAARRCDGLQVSIAAPRVDEERVALYRKWHASRERGPRLGGKRAGAGKLSPAVLFSSSLRAGDDLLQRGAAHGGGAH